MENESEVLDQIWNEISQYFDLIKVGLQKVKEIKGKLDSKDHQLTINQIVENIYEEM
jgi:hypothetical protein